MPRRRRAAPAEEVATVRKKKPKGDHVTSDSDEDVTLLEIFQREIQTRNQTTTPESDDDKPLCPRDSPESDDDKQLFPRDSPEPAASSSQVPPPSPPPPQQPAPNFVDNPIIMRDKIARQLQKVVAGGDKIQYMFPLPDANLEPQVVLLIQAAHHFHRVKSLELQAKADPLSL